MTLHDSRMIRKSLARHLAPVVLLAALTGCAGSDIAMTSLSGGTQTTTLEGPVSTTLSQPGQSNQTPGIDNSMQLDLRGLSSPPSPLSPANSATYNPAPNLVMAPLAPSSGQTLPVPINPPPTASDPATVSLRGILSGGPYTGNQTAAAPATNAPTAPGPLIVTPITGTRIASPEAPNDFGNSLGPPPTRTTAAYISAPSPKISQGALPPPKTNGGPDGELNESQLQNLF